MKLFGLFMTSALATQNEGDRMFSNEASFFTNLPASDSKWETEPGYVKKRFNQINTAIDFYFDNFVVSKSNGAERVGNIMRDHLKKTMNMVEKVKTFPKCQDSGRKRRDDGEGGLEPRFKLSLSDSNHDAQDDLFKNIARYARNELQANCPVQSQRLLKRVDRMRRIWYWQACRPEFNIDSEGKSCDWAAADENPRTAIDKFNRETNVKITAKGCQGPAELVCPAGGNIKVTFARYGRRKENECAANAIAATTVCWKKAGNITKEAAAACNGKPSCTFEHYDTSLCPGIDTYARVNYVCE